MKSKKSVCVEKMCHFENVVRSKKFKNHFFFFFFSIPFLFVRDFWFIFLEGQREESKVLKDA